MRAPGESGKSQILTLESLAFRTQQQYDFRPLNLVELTAVAYRPAPLLTEACSHGFQVPKTVCAPTRKKRLQVLGLAEPHLECCLPFPSSDLL